MIWQPKRPPAEARFSSPWTNSTTSRHNQGSPECVAIADTTGPCYTGTSGPVPSRFTPQAIALHHELRRRGYVFGGRTRL
jgi:hypothetical protein